MPLSASSVISTRPICPTTTSEDGTMFPTIFSRSAPKFQLKRLPSTNNIYYDLKSRRSTHGVRRYNKRRVKTHFNRTFVPLLVFLPLLLLLHSAVMVHASEDDQYTDNNNGYFDATDGSDASGENKFTNFYDEYGNKLSYDGMSMMPISCIPL
jgi:hypothetical protein